MPCITFYPAIDVKDGKCVRLAKGDMRQATVFGDNPAAQAQEFVGAGASWIHVVDLNAAFAGQSINTDAIESIRAAVACPLQLGGGIRDMAMAEHWISLGINRIVLGTAAVKDPKFVREACAAFPGYVAVGIDVRGGQVAVEGWAETSDISATHLARRFEDSGVAAIIHTDIDRDGLLGGPNLEASAALANAVDIPIIVSGGLATLDDLRAIKNSAVRTPGLTGVISGRAIYDGRIDLAEALALLAD